MGWALWEKDRCEGALDSMNRMNKIPRDLHQMLSGIYACPDDEENARNAYQTFYVNLTKPTISEQRIEWENIWTAEVSLERWLDHVSIAGMKEN